MRTVVYTLVVKRIKKRLYGLLRWSEQYTKTDMVYLAEGGFWLTAGQTIASFTTLIVAIAFANLVSPETYGTYKYILSIASIFAIFTMPGMNTAVSRATARGHEGVLHTSTRIRVLSSVIGSACTLFGAGYYFVNENLEIALALLIIAATLPFFETLTGHMAYLVGKRRFDLRAQYQVGIQIFSAVILIITIFLTNNLTYILLAYFAPIALARGTLYYFTSRNISKEVSEYDKLQTLRYGTHLTVIKILSKIALQIDKILLWKFFGPTQLAIYSFATAIPEQIKAPLKGVSDLAFPKFAAQTPEQIEKNFAKLLRKIFLYAMVILILSVVYFFVAPYVFQFIFPQYTESILYSQIFILTLFGTINTVFTTLFEAQAKTRAQYTVQTIQPIMRIGLLILLIPLYGIWGAIFAVLATHAFTAVFLIGMTMRTFKKH